MPQANALLTELCQLGNASKTLSELFHGLKVQVIHVQLQKWFLNNT